MRILSIAAGIALAASLGAATASAQDAGAASLAGVKIAVADFDRTTAFYAALGMRAGTRYGEHERGLEWSGPAQGSRIIMVHGSGPADGSARGIKPGGAFLMIGVPDMTATLDRLKAAGFTGFGQPKVTPRASILMLRDPDGNQIELLGRPAAPAPSAR